MASCVGVKALPRGQLSFKKPCHPERSRSSGGAKDLARIATILVEHPSHAALTANSPTSPGSSLPEPPAPP